MVLATMRGLFRSFIIRRGANPDRMARSIPSIHRSVKDFGRLRQRPGAQCLGEKFRGDFVVSQSRRMGSIVFHAICFLVWHLINSLGREKAFRFDPFPYALLRLVVSMESIFLCSF